MLELVSVGITGVGIDGTIGAGIDGIIGAGTIGVFMILFGVAVFMEVVFMAAGALTMVGAGITDFTEITITVQEALLIMQEDEVVVYHVPPMVLAETVLPIREITHQEEAVRR